MCCRNGSIECDIFNLTQNLRTEKGAERFERDQLHPSAESCFQKTRELAEVIKRLRAGLELNQYIDVAINALLPTYKRAEQCQPFHAEGFDLSLAVSKDSQDLLLGLDCHWVSR